MVAKSSVMMWLVALASLVLSTLLWVTSAPVAQAHEVRPSVADVEVNGTEVRMNIRLVVEPLIAGIDLAGLEDTDESPLSGLYDRLRAETPDSLEQSFRNAWPTIAAGFKLIADGGLVAPELVSVSIPEVGDVELPRDSQIEVRGMLPPGASPVQVGWSSSYGPLIVRQAETDDVAAYSAILNNGDLSAPLPRDGVVLEDPIDVFLRFTISGFEHIIPKGIDHILFVLGLFFYALRWGPLLWQVTAFTLAHTVTLAMASLGWVSIPASVVEPLIAASIAYVAIENIVANQPGRTARPVTWQRLAIVFAFGLLHGLGFAFVLGDVGLDPTRFIVGLVGFNVGVEIGQLACIAVAFVLLGLPLGRFAWYPTGIAIPASAIIGAVGLYWAYERVFLG